jgi:hypothetical protein
MGEMVKRRKVVVLLAFLFVFLFVIPTAQISLYNPSGLTQVSDSGQPYQIQLYLSPQSDPYGPPRPYNESAMGLDSGGGTGRTINLPGGSGTLPVTLGYKWSGTRVTTSVLSIWDQKNWIRNGTYNTGVNTPHATNYSRPWYTVRWYDTHKTTGPNATIDQASWDSTGRYVKTSLPWWNLYTEGGRHARRYYTGEFATWNETFIIPRGTILAANLSLAYRPDYDTGLFALDSFKMFVEINGHRVFERGQAAMKLTEAGHWNVRTNIDAMTDLALNPVFNTPAQQNISIAVGVIYDSAGDYFGGDFNTQNGCWFDNVTLVLKALAKPEQINLKLNAPSLPNVNCSIVSPSPSTYGQGTGTLTGFVVGPAPTAQTTYTFDFTSNVTSPVKGSIVANATIYASRNSAVQTTFENQGSKVKWLIPFVTSFQQDGQGIGTTFYTMYYFNTSVPNSWVYTTCVDPGGSSHNTQTDPSFSIYPVGSLSVLKVNVTGIGQYSSGSNSYAPYRLNAESDNYVKEVFLQKFNSTSGEWENETSSFEPNDYMRIAALIASPTGVRANSGTANMSSWYGTPAATWKPLNQTTPNNGWANFTFPVANSIAFASNYTVEVAWLNETLGEPQAGVGTETFQIDRTAQIESFAPAQLARIAQDEYFTVSISIVDEIDHTPIQGALAQYTVPWKGGAQTMVWNSLGQNYTSQPQERMPSTAHGQRWVNITASKPYYNTVSVDVSVYAILATQAAPQNFIQTIYWGTSWYNFTISYYGVNPPNNTAISGASVSCQTGFWQNRTYTSEPVAGEYDISVYSAGVTENTYAISFLIAKLGSDWQPQSFYRTLIINPVPTSALGSFIPTDGGDLVADSLTVSSGDKAVMIFKYADTGDNGITGASLTYTSDIGSGSLSEIPSRPGYYAMNLTTSGASVGSHGVHVIAQKVHYATQSKDVTISIVAPGLPVWLLVGGSLGSAGIVVGVFGAFWYIRRARIPFIIKKIDESLKLIGKGDHEAATAVPLRTRDELVVGITQERIDAFSKRPVSEEGPSEAEAVTAEAPASGAAAALKTELAAVETKEKPSEAIEEIEMDTLDAELQKLEKFEEKEKLPDGAKEVRDVIEKYKDGKKKKKE